MDKNNNTETQAIMPTIDLNKKVFALEIEAVNENLVTGEIKLTFTNKRYASFSTSREMLGESAPVHAGYFYVVTNKGVCVISPQQFETLTQ